MKMPRVRLAGILIKNNKVLLIKHKKNNEEYWLLPGGGLDYGETFQKALKREFMEETNLNVDVKEMVFISESISPTLSRHIVNLFFIVEYINGELKIGEEDILEDLDYISIEELENSIIYPNIKNELVTLIKTGKIEIKYLGNRWE